MYRIKKPIRRTSDHIVFIYLYILQYNIFFYIYHHLNETDLKTIQVTYMETFYTFSTYLKCLTLKDFEEPCDTNVRE